MTMAILAVGRRFGILIKCPHREPTITEILSDSIVKAMMAADGIDAIVLEAQLRSVAQNMDAVRRRRAPYD
jgi:Asp/Glu/hydantoin racemase